MRFIVDLDLVPEDGGEPFSQEQVRACIENYTFSPGVSFEMPNDPVNDAWMDEPGVYRKFTVRLVTVRSI